MTLALAFCLAGCSRSSTPRNDAASQVSSRPPTIVFLSDFGTANDAVAVCKAVIAGIAPNARIMDITHQVTPFSIEEGARFLEGVSPYYPAGTIFIAVVDPGVGTSRKALVVKTKKGQYFVAPDNGILTPVADRDGVEAAREITNGEWMIQSPISSTFHGRDIFSPAAAHLAAGWDWTRAGPVVPQLVRLAPKVSTTSERGISGEIIALDDPYGSPISDIPAAEFVKLGYQLGEKIPVRLHDRPMSIPYARTFMDVRAGEPLLYLDSRGRVALAVNQGNFSQIYKINPGTAFFIPRRQK